MKKYDPHIISLANDLARELDDMASLHAYLQYADKYKEDYLLQIRDKVLSIPLENIRKSRGALFTYLINHHGGAEYTRDSV